MLDAIPDGRLISAAGHLLPMVKRTKVRLDTRLVPEDSEIRMVTEQRERQERLKNFGTDKEDVLVSLEENTDGIEQRLTKKEHKRMKGEGRFYQHQWNKDYKKNSEGKTYKEKIPSMQHVTVSQREISTPLGSIGVKSVTSTFDIPLPPQVKTEFYNPTAITMNKLAKQIEEYHKDEEAIEVD